MKYLEYMTQKSLEREKQLALEDYLKVYRILYPYIDIGYDIHGMPVFVCLLCHEQSHKIEGLKTHLTSDVHEEMVTTATNTLLKTKPWPFKDGRFFFHKFMANGNENNWDEHENQILENKANSYEDELVISRVMQSRNLSNLIVKQVGIGRIGAQFNVQDGVLNIHKIWCEWMGNEELSNHENTPDHEFGVVIFPYKYGLGSNENLELIELLESEVKEDEPCASKMQKFRIELKMISRKTCDICKQCLLLGNDVAALVNKRTGRIVCSARNTYGIFHVYHVSCLIQWLLLYEVYEKTEHKSAFCPNCQGKAQLGNNERLIPETKISRSKTQLLDAHRSWMRSPEVLPNCTMGLRFPLQPVDIQQETVASLKLLHFYRPKIE